MTRERRLNALVVLLAVVLVVVLQPLALRIGEDGPTVDCGIVTFVTGTDRADATEACRDAYKGRVAAAMVLLGGIALLAGELVARRAPRRTVPEPPARPPGEDPSVLGGIRHAAATISFRVLVGAALVLLVAFVAVTRPVSVGAAECGLREQLFGASDADATATCRQAFAGRAVGGLLVLGAIAVVVALLTWLVQYHRGAALGAIWHRSDAPRALLARAGAPIAVLVAVAIVAAGESGPPAAATASAPATVATTTPPEDRPLAAQVTPAPTFSTAAPVALAPPPARPTTTARVATTTTTTAVAVATDEPLVRRRRRASPPPRPRPRSRSRSPPTNRSRCTTHRGSPPTRTRWTPAPSPKAAFRWARSWARTTSTPSSA